MQIKKNPKKDLTRKSLLFFQIGLVVVLLLSLWGINHKSYEEKDNGEQEVVNLADLEPEDVEVVNMPENTPPPPPPPPKIPDKIEVVDDDEDIEEDELITAEDDDTPVIEVADVGEIESTEAEEAVEEEIEEVPFQAIQDVPIFPGCEKFKDNNKRKQCMSEGVQKFVNKRFNTDLGSDLGLSGVTRISVQFTVDEFGKVTDIKTRAPEPELEAEARRVVSQLPQMQPGKQRDKAVRVIYQLPIVFQVR